MRIVHKKIRPDQAVNSAHCSDVLRRLRENVRRLRPELWLQKNWLLHHDNKPPNTSFFTRELLTENNMTVVLRPPYFSLFPRLKLKLKGLHFDTLR
jgi:hypothetical protein